MSFEYLRYDRVPNGPGDLDNYCAGRRVLMIMGLVNHVELGDPSKIQAEMDYFLRRNPFVVLRRIFVFNFSFDPVHGLNPESPIGIANDPNSLIIFPPEGKCEGGSMVEVHLHEVMSYAAVRIILSLEEQMKLCENQLNSSISTISTSSSSMSSSISTSVPPSLLSTNSSSMPHSSLHSSQSTPNQTLTLATFYDDFEEASVETMQSSSTSTAILLPSSMLINQRSKRISKKNSIGRIRKWMGDLCLQVCSPLDALEHYSKAITECRNGGDAMWLAGSLEGFVAAILLHFHREGNVDEWAQTKDARSSTFASSKNVHNSSAANTDGDEEEVEDASLQVIRIVEERITEALDIYSKSVVFCVLEVECCLRMARVYESVHRKDCESKILECILRACSVPGLNVQQQIEVTVEGAFLFRRLGLKRKYALLLYLAGLMSAESDNHIIAHSLLRNACNQYGVYATPRTLSNPPTHFYLHSSLYSKMRGLQELHGMHDFCEGDTNNNRSEVLRSVNGEEVASESGNDEDILLYDYGASWISIRRALFAQGAYIAKECGDMTSAASFVAALLRLLQESSKFHNLIPDNVDLRQGTCAAVPVHSAASSTSNPTTPISGNNPHVGSSPFNQLLGEDAASTTLNLHSKPIASSSNRETDLLLSRSSNTEDRGRSDSMSSSSSSLFVPPSLSVGIWKKSLKISASSPTVSNDQSSGENYGGRESVSGNNGNTILRRGLRLISVPSIPSLSNARNLALSKMRITSSGTKYNSVFSNANPTSTTSGTNSTTDPSMSTSSRLRKKNIQNKKRFLSSSSSTTSTTVSSVSLTTSVLNTSTVRSPSLRGDSTQTILTTATDEIDAYDTSKSITATLTSLRDLAIESYGFLDLLTHNIPPNTPLILPISLSYASPLVLPSSQRPFKLEAESAAANKYIQSKKKIVHIGDGAGDDKEAGSHSDSHASETQKGQSAFFYDPFAAKRAKEKSSTIQVLWESGGEGRIEVAFSNSLPIPLTFGCVRPLLRGCRHVAMAHSLSIPPNTDLWKVELSVMPLEVGFLSLIGIEIFFNNAVHILYVDQLGMGKASKSTQETVSPWTYPYLPSSSTANDKTSRSTNSRERSISSSSLISTKTTEITVVNECVGVSLSPCWDTDMELPTSKGCISPTSPSLASDSSLLPSKSSSSNARHIDTCYLGLYEGETRYEKLKFTPIVPPSISCHGSHALASDSHLIGDIRVKLTEFHTDGSTKTSTIQDFKHPLCALASTSTVCNHGVETMQSVTLSGEPLTTTTWPNSAHSKTHPLSSLPLLLNESCTMIRDGMWKGDCIELGISFTWVKCISAVQFEVEVIPRTITHRLEECDDAASAMDGCTEPISIYCKRSTCRVNFLKLQGIQAEITRTLTPKSLLFSTNAMTLLQQMLPDCSKLLFVQPSSRAVVRFVNSSSLHGIATNKSSTLSVALPPLSIRSVCLDLHNNFQSKESSDDFILLWKLQNTGNVPVLPLSTPGTSIVPSITPVRQTTISPINVPSSAFSMSSSLSSSSCTASILSTAFITREGQSVIANSQLLHNEVPNGRLLSGIGVVSITSTSTNVTSCIGDRIDLEFSIQILRSALMNNDVARNKKLETQIVVIEECWYNTYSNHSIDCALPNDQIHTRKPPLIPQHVMLSGKSHALYTINGNCPTSDVLDTSPQVISIPLQLFFLQEGHFELLLCVRSIDTNDAERESAGNEWLISSPIGLRIVSSDLFE